MAGLLNTEQKPQGRKATEGEQATYKLMVMQVIRYVTQPKVRDALKQLVDTVGPAQALAQVVGQALAHVGKAAKESGAKVPMHTGTSALKEILTVLASMLASAGKVDNVEQVVAEATQLIMSGGQQQQQAQPQEQMPPQAMPAEQPQPMGV